MAENPMTWGNAEHVVDKAIRDAGEAHQAGMIGLSLVRQITDALRESCHLRGDDEAAHLFYSNPEHLRPAGPGRKRSDR